MTPTTPTMPPNAALQLFTPFIGTWRTVGTHGMIADTTLHGRATFSWHESGAFVLVRSDVDEDAGIPAGVALIGSDNVLGSYMMLYYDERGVSRHYQVSIAASTLRWWRDDPKLSQRYTLTMSEDQQIIAGKGEISIDGADWEQDLDLMYSRI